eukprot:GILJ01008596.1.p1 GENE.GILJ01008596.1~~GILJ01008596.1.p1  ORF type:complete len:882 (+),score=38.30 GILJ01008596.1:1724-4369(+)
MLIRKTLSFFHPTNMPRPNSFLFAVCTFTISHPYASAALQFRRACGVETTTTQSTKKRLETTSLAARAFHTQILSTSAPPSELLSCAIEDGVNMTLQTYHKVHSKEYVSEVFAPLKQWHAPLTIGDLTIHDVQVKTVQVFRGVPPNPVLPFSPRMYLLDVTRNSFQNLVQKLLKRTGGDVDDRFLRLCHSIEGLLDDKHRPLASLSLLFDSSANLQTVFPTLPQVHKLSKLSLPPLPNLLLVVSGAVCRHCDDNTGIPLRVPGGWQCSRCRKFVHYIPPFYGDWQSRYDLSKDISIESRSDSVPLPLSNYHSMEIDNEVAMEFLPLSETASHVAPMMTESTHEDRRIRQVQSFLAVPNILDSVADLFLLNSRKIACVVHTAFDFDKVKHQLASLDNDYCSTWEVVFPYSPPFELLENSYLYLPSHDTITMYRNLLCRYGKTFFEKHSNLVLIAGGFKITMFTQTKEFVVVFYVRHKGLIPEGECDINETIKQNLDKWDAPIDIVEGSYHDTLDYNQLEKMCKWHDPACDPLPQIRAGCQIGPDVSTDTKSGGAGTVGFIVRDSQHNEYLVSNKHVLYACDQTRILQPSYTTLKGNMTSAQEALTNHKADFHNILSELTRNIRDAEALGDPERLETCHVALEAGYSKFGIDSQSRQGALQSAQTVLSEKDRLHIADYLEGQNCNISFDDSELGPIDVGVDVAVARVKRSTPVIGGFVPGDAELVGLQKVPPLSFPSSDSRTIILLSCATREGEHCFVYKQGARTSLTKGYIVCDLPCLAVCTPTFALPLDYDTVMHKLFRAPETECSVSFAFQYLITPVQPMSLFALKGDSGSSIWTETGEIIGLQKGVMLTHPCITIANPIGPVLNVLRQLIRDQNVTLRS